MKKIISNKKLMAAIASAFVLCMILGIVIIPGKKTTDHKSDNATEETTSVTSKGDVNTLEEDSTEDEIAEVEEAEATVVTKKAKKKATYKGPYAGKFVVNIDSEFLNVRKTADKNGELVGKLYVGSGGKVLKKGKYWTKISSGSVKGYVRTEYIVCDKAAEKKAKQVGNVEATVIADLLMVRSEPTTNSEAIGEVSYGEVYVSLGVTDGWIKISYNGVGGYICADYVTTELKIGKAVSIEEEMEAARLEQERLAKEQEEAERKAAEEAEMIAAAMENSHVMETVQGAAYNLSEEDVYMIACVVSCEAGYEVYEGQLATANIILNRLASGIYGASIKDILYASGQFTVVNTDHFARTMQAGPLPTALQATKDAVAGTNNVPGMTCFIASWAANCGAYTEYTVIGNQVYYR